MIKFIKSKIGMGLGVIVLGWMYPYIPTYFSQKALEEQRMQRDALQDVVVSNTTAAIGHIKDQYSQSLAVHEQTAQDQKDQELATQQKQQQAQLEAQQAPVRELAGDMKVFASEVSQMGARFNAGLEDVNVRVSKLEQSIHGIDTRVDQSLGVFNAKLDTLVQTVTDNKAAQPQSVPVAHGQVSVNKGTQVVAPIQSNCPPNCDCQKGSVQYGSVQPVGNRVHSYRTR